MRRWAAAIGNRAPRNALESGEPVRIERDQAPRVEPHYTGRSSGPAPATVAPSLDQWLTTTDHKRLIGNLYLVTLCRVLRIGGVMALAIRAELAFSGPAVPVVRASTTSS